MPDEFIRFEQKVMQNNIIYNDPSPLYEQIEKIIKNKISSGELKPGDQIGSHHELSKEFNVSLITIKKALSNLVKDKVLFTRVGKGTYVAEKKGISVDLSKHKTIGLVLQELTHPFFTKIVHGLEERAYELGFNILISNSSGKIEKEERQIEHFRNIGVDALTIGSLSLQYRATDAINKLHDDNFPYAMFSYMHDPDYWYVGSDQELGGFMATEHLIKLGYKSIGYAHVGKGNLLSEVRKNGYARALMEYDLPYVSEKIFCLSDEYTDKSMNRFELGYKFGKEFVFIYNKPEALFLYSDLVALGFAQAVQEAGMSIPEDIAIVGFDNIEIGQFSSVSLTTIEQPANKIGKTIVDVLDRRLSGKDISNRIIFKPSLVVRDSCGSKLKTESSTK